MHPIIAKIQATMLKKNPEVKTGFTVRVSQKVVEGTKERIQHFEGLVIKVGHGAGTEKTFTVRKIVEGIGVEKIFPFHSPVITKIHVLKKAKVRREKLYYMRGLSGKSARLSEKHVTDEDRAAEEAKMSALYEEAMMAEAKKQKDEAGDMPEEAIEEVSLEENEAMAEEPKAQEENAAVTPEAEMTEKEEEKKEN